MGAANTQPRRGRVDDGKASGMNDPIQFALAAFLLLVVPGPTNTIMASAGAINGGERPWFALLAELCGYLAIVVLAKLALLPLTDLYPPVGVALKCVVVAYLAYAAFKLWRTRLSAEGASDRVRMRVIFVTTFLNPKGLIIAIAILPREHPMLIGFFGLFAMLVLVTGGAWFMAGRAIGVLAGHRASILPRVGSLVLAGFAGYLATTLVV